MRVQIPSIGYDEQHFNNGNNYFEGPSCGSEDSPMGNSLFYVSFWRLSIPCNGVYSPYENPSSTDPNFISVSGWPAGIIITLIN